MITCKVCGKEFEINKDDVYIARDDTATGFGFIGQTTEEKQYQAINCVHCGCQYILQAIKRVSIVSVNQAEEIAKQIIDNAYEEEEKILLDAKSTEDELRSKKEEFKNLVKSFIKTI